MGVTVSHTATQSADGKTITLSDTSVLTSPDVVTSFTRVYTIKDENGTVLTTLTIPSGQTTVTYPITKDKWLDITLLYDGATDYSGRTQHYFFRNTANKLISANQQGCCTSKSDKENMCLALRFIKGAEYAAPIGNGVAFQKDIDSANTYLDLVL